MRIYLTVVHGHRIELRHHELGGQTVLVDGRPVSNRRLAGLTRPSHFIEIEDEAGRTRQLEVRLVDVSKLGLGRYRALVLVDGIERARLEAVDPASPPDRCANCGYDLAGLPVENGEVRCPECGRHAPGPP